MINVDKKFVEKTVNTYGNDKQLIVAIEELSELQKEICKHLRGKTNRAHIVEETADVLIMIGNVMFIFDIKDKELAAAINKKTNRTINRMLNNEE